MKGFGRFNKVFMSCNAKRKNNNAVFKANTSAGFSLVLVLMPISSQHRSQQ